MVQYSEGSTPLFFRFPQYNRYSLSLETWCPHIYPDTVNFTLSYLSFNLPDAG
jgi:hypothetical protein